MRAITIFGVTLVLAMLLQGCGRKAPLTLPAPKAQAPQPQITNSQTPDSQKSEASSSR